MIWSGHMYHVWALVLLFARSRTSRTAWSRRLGTWHAQMRRPSTIWKAHSFNSQLKLLFFLEHGFSLYCWQVCLALLLTFLGPSVHGPEFANHALIPADTGTGTTSSWLGPRDTGRLLGRSNKMDVLGPLTKEGFPGRTHSHASLFHRRFRVKVRVFVQSFWQGVEALCARSTWISWHVQYLLIHSLTHSLIHSLTDSLTGHTPHTHTHTH